MSYLKIIKTISLFVAIFTTSAHAGILNYQDLPDKIIDYIHTKHPQAKEVQASQAIHFGKPLYEVSFIENEYDQNNQPYEEKLFKLFTLKGRFFTNALFVDKNALHLIPTTITDSLQSNFPDYKIETAKLITNPNGVGEEYEFDVLTAGKIHHVSIAGNGALIRDDE